MNAARASETATLTTIALLGDPQKGLRVRCELGNGTAATLQCGTREPFGWLQPRLANAAGFEASPAAKSSPDTQPADFISREVDPILDKISAHGIHSLTAREREILEQARAQMLVDENAALQKNLARGNAPSAALTVLQSENERLK